ncbi:MULTISPECIES: AbrB/MazE/SpoVT family DNA-binding domain-containing protein [unclassified Rhizobium]|uniref:AbrB/MazE/SpoVT family DNA-binding domain-containing protein n=1 Tax=unclassified Rhizobium TaxID=2613769 RepID=UPI0007160212|nr:MULTISPECIES: AbrB/MazE/SpoVT family DNA-binding domain-containing protein [unclassified Rhizobium]KQS83255.1 antitoxin [Rhizobium sp. Leaf386]KQS88857.1 antitoxin [Rhizobium sp. Leaf391]KQT92704.1 antitoxin [Rhizobium sp. Leaf453]
MLSAVKKFGNSSGIIIPKPLLAEVGVETGDSVELKVEAGRIVIERVATVPRQGWADDAKRLADTEDDMLTWPEFGNSEDETFKW